jgi:hypothetical protein
LHQVANNVSSDDLKNNIHDNSNVQHGMHITQKVLPHIFSQQTFIGNT